MFKRPPKLYWYIELCQLCHILNGAFVLVSGFLLAAVPGNECLCHLEPEHQIMGLLYWELITIILLSG